MRKLVLRRVLDISRKKKGASCQQDGLGELTKESGRQGLESAESSHLS